MFYRDLGDLRRLLHFLFEQLTNDLINDLIRKRTDFVLGLRLNRMLNKDRLVLRHAQGRTLGVGSANEFGGGHVRGWDALFFKVDNIVRTARNAGPSIAERFDDRITFFLQLRLDRLRRRARHCWFHTA